MRLNYERIVKKVSKLRVDDVKKIGRLKRRRLDGVKNIFLILGQSQRSWTSGG